MNAVTVVEPSPTVNLFPRLGDGRAVGPQGRRRGHERVRARPTAGQRSIRPGGVRRRPMGRPANRGATSRVVVGSGLGTTTTP